MNKVKVVMIQRVQRSSINGRVEKDNWGSGNSYNDAVASGSAVFGGLIYFPANSTDDIQSASAIGTWCRVV